MLQDPGFDVIVLEKSNYLGGISRTVNYKGNRIDIGGHRFFSKSDKVMDWWTELMPIQSELGGNIQIAYQNKTRTIQTEKSDDKENVLLVRKRKSRIFYRGQFFNYPIALSMDTIKKLGYLQTCKIGFSYIKAVLFPIKNEQNLEQFFINRFGKVLYQTFFKSYTEKVWGVKCKDIDASWGAQRIKGLSILKTIQHFIKGSKKSSDIRQKSTETSLIEYFLYPKYGPGQMWELVGKQIEQKGGKILMNAELTGLKTQNKDVSHIQYVQDGANNELKIDHLISTIPVKDLVQYLSDNEVTPISSLSSQLQYRDFITVGILLNGLKIDQLEDNWIYVQEPDVEVGRLQIFNNWSPHLVQDKEHIWIGMEYFCFENDLLWNLTDEQMIEFAMKELVQMGFADPTHFVDGVSIKMPKTYPAYFGVYKEFSKIKDYLLNFNNLYPIGRNGMHKYNNQDHSMLTAMATADLLKGNPDIHKAEIWDINTEQEYHENK